MVDDYQTTNHVPEALHRLTEIYLQLGLRDQARKTAAVLGYNYPGQRWYEDSYNDLVRQTAAQPARRRPPPPRRAAAASSARTLRTRSSETDFPSAGRRAC